MGLRDLQRPKRLTARSELREYFVVHRGNVAGVDLSIVQRKELLAMSRGNGTCYERVLGDVTAVGEQEEERVLGGIPAHEVRRTVSRT